MEIYQTEQLQLEALKRFWKNHYRKIIVGLVVLSLSIGGWQYYRHHQQVQAQKASLLYDLMMQGLEQGDQQTSKTQAVILNKRYAQTPYGGFATLLLAKFAVAENDFVQAKTHLQFAIQNPFELVQHLARTRLAQIQIEEGLPDQALETLGTKTPEGYITLYESVRGDIYVAQNQIDKAKQAYQKAIDAAGLGTSVSQLVLKLEDL